VVFFVGYPRRGTLFSVNDLASGKCAFDQDIAALPSMPARASLGEWISFQGENVVIPCSTAGANNVPVTVPLAEILKLVRK
jgi:hypothetical protein